ncbi:MAG: hypothetical protein WCQ53_03065 [bacterium]
MRYLKEDLQAWILKSKRAITPRYFCLILLLLLFNSACSHKFVKLETAKNAKVINMTLKMKIYRNGDVEKLTVYAQADRESKHAILDGLGKFDKYVFHMDISKDSFCFEDYINNEKQSGQLKDFDIIPLTQEDVFEKVDISKPQPIVFNSADKSIRVEITVKEQH